MKQCALLLGWMLAAGPAVADSLPGLWVYEAEEGQSGCQSTGRLEIEPALSGKAEDMPCRFEQTSTCAWFPAGVKPLTVRQSCKIARDEYHVRITSTDILEYRPGDHPFRSGYMLDNFVLSFEGDDTMFGLHLDLENSSFALFKRAEPLS